MFTKEQRQVLNGYSKQLYGSESRWLKELKQGQFRIPAGTKEVSDTVETVQFPRTRKGRPGQIMSRDKALAKGLIKEDQVPLERTRQVQEYRDPTYEDIVKAFEQMIDSHKISRLANDRLIQVLAYRYVTDNLIFNISLITKEDEQYVQDLADSFKFCPEVHREALTARVATPEKPADGLPVDAVQFLTDVTFAFNNAEAAKELAEDSLSKVDLSQTTSKVPYQFAQVQMGAAARKVNPSTVAARRAKNKASRVARRRNRAS